VHRNITESVSMLAAVMGTEKQFASFQYNANKGLCAAAVTPVSVR